MVFQNHIDPDETDVCTHTPVIPSFQGGDQNKPVMKKYTSNFTIEMLGF